MKTEITTWRHLTSRWKPPTQVPLEQQPRGLCAFSLLAPAPFPSQVWHVSLTALEEIVTDASSPGRKHNPEHTPAWPHLIPYSKWSITHLCRALEENGSCSHHEGLCTTQPHVPEGLFSIMLILFRVILFRGPLISQYWKRIHFLKTVSWTRLPYRHDHANLTMH